MQNVTKRILSPKEILSLKDLKVEQIDNLIKKIYCKPVACDCYELKDKILYGFRELKGLVKNYRTANNEVHRIKKAVKRNEMTSLQHEEAKAARQKILEDRDGLIKKLRIYAKRYELKVRLAHLKTLSNNVRADLEQAKSTCEQFKEEFSHFKR